jgi:hypothetical protein
VYSGWASLRVETERLYRDAPEIYLLVGFRKPSDREELEMAKCEVCGNEYDKTFRAYNKL